MEHRVGEACGNNLTVQEACDSWHSAAYLLETMPSVLYILMRHGEDPNAAITAAVNDTYDNDTIAALVGTAVGALHGASALPAHWKAGLLGRLGAVDDGRLATLLDETRALWFESGPPSTKLNSQPAGGTQ